MLPRKQYHIGLLFIHGTLIKIAQNLYRSTASVMKVELFIPYRFSRHEIRVVRGFCVTRDLSKYKRVARVASRDS